MNQLLAIGKNDAAAHPRERFHVRNSTTARPRERHRALFDMLRPPIINQFRADWFALRIWEDDGGGGGQGQLSDTPRP